jgi:hypothetical protein
MSQFIFGWPAIALAVCAYAVAFRRGQSVLGFVGLALATPFLWFGTNVPGGWWISLILFVTLGCSAAFLQRGQRGWAALCFGPFFVLVLIGVAAVARP